jgi:hypothetical protein
MDYWIYENWTAEHKAVTHRSNCSFCKDGRGVHPGSSDRNGHWQGPYSTLPIAAQAAARTGRSVRRCGHCKP